MSSSRAANCWGTVQYSAPPQTPSTLMLLALVLAQDTLQSVVTVFIVVDYVSLFEVLWPGALNLNGSFHSASIMWDKWRELRKV